MSRIAIVGSRGYPRLDLVRGYVATLADDDVVVSGGASGVDTEAVNAANARGLGYRVYRPGWQQHGKGAAAMRNREIVDDCDKLIAFWDGESRGTAMTVEMARKAGKPVVVVPL